MSGRDRLDVVAARQVAGSTGYDRGFTAACVAAKLRIRALHSHVMRTPWWRRGKRNAQLAALEHAFVAIDQLQNGGPYGSR